MNTKNYDAQDQGWLDEAGWGTEHITYEDTTYKVTLRLPSNGPPPEEGEIVAAIHQGVGLVRTSDSVQVVRLGPLQS